MAPPRIGLIGATGETGSSVLNGLLSASQDFHIVALARPSSLAKPANLALKAKEIELQIVASLQNIDILISAICPSDQLAQISLATAAKTAGIKRFIPCAFVTVIPAGGIHLLRDQKQQVYEHIFKLGLHYTIIDVGWWYQISISRVPSGKLDAYAFVTNKNEIPGDGTVLSGLTDLRDIGKYVAKIVVDDRTLNKWIFVYNELWSQNSIYDLVENKTGDGEKIARNYVSKEDLVARIEGAGDVADMAALMVKVPAQYMHSWGVRGDNTPEYAKYLGDLTSKDLYPDLQFTSFESYVDEALAGTAKTVYEGLKAKFAAAQQQNSS
ncbi:Putative NmrA-like domain, NAD(P)-binding domain superfamily [Septoria linicola]|uniref:NmrA-like domain, NAD(P)-binding domain superfamily n=1 Tax=Septoria linicola TaxID=215465 RepID=A0A9Q9EJA5_9PEZI|nr:putative NmrA-like domain, NAD(P)-binding domain superfamily [Septoria linicola]USW53596.1 Putative NmrA-like domain, NAD(P)-binding domain superfamily [Septoria linicola]